MGRIAKLFQAKSRPASTFQGGVEREVTFTFADLLAASAFLDFGGIPDERWNNAWRAGREPDDVLENDQKAPSFQLIENSQTIPEAQRTQTAYQPHALKPNARDLDARKHLHVCPSNRVSALSNDRTQPELRAHSTGWSALDVAMCIAAFGLVALVVFFGRPPSRPTDFARAADAEGTAIILVPEQR